MSNLFQLPVKEFMSRHVVAIEASDSIHDALNAMGENRVSAVPVLDQRRQCVGILSTSDLVDMTRDVDGDLYDLELIDGATQRVVLDKLAHSLGHESVQSYMSECVTTVPADATLAEATRAMVRNSIHHLPVVNERGELVGIVSTMDVLGAVADAALV